MYRAGLRELRLICSRKPRWYLNAAERMLTRIVSSYLSLFGARKLLVGLASPAFFDGLAASAWLDELGGGATTIIATALKNFIRPEMGLAVLGGKRPKGYAVPRELEKIAEIFGFDEATVERLKYASKMVAKVDNAAIQDGFQLYLHLMVVSHEGEWTVIQQGLKPMANKVRRYHWTSMNLRDFVDEPHSGIISAERESLVLDMTSRRSGESRKVCVELVNGDLTRLKRLQQAAPPTQLTLTEFDAREQGRCPFKVPRVSWASLLKVQEASPRDYEELLSIRGVGPSMVRFLAGAGIELCDVYPSLEDPATLFNEVVEKSVEDRWIYELVEAIKEADLSLTDKRKALNRLSSIFKPVGEFT